MIEITGYKDKHEFERDGIKSIVYLMDCMDGIKQIPEKYFDLALIDPPFGIKASKPSIKPNVVRQKNGTKLKISAPLYAPKKWDNTPVSRDVIQEIIKTSHNQIVFGVNYFPYPELSGGRIVWDKMNHDSDQFGCEIAYNSFNNRTDVIHYMWAGMMQGVTPSININIANMQLGDKSKNEKRIHPTQKPVKLYDWIYKNYGQDCKNVLDTHLGSQSNRIAALKASIAFMGFELEEDYFRDGNKRFEDFTKQLTLL